ncbi:MAG: hypothetical protein CSA62_13430 [Planctomycetota bacterium]|nr:MAG: hypothetical protein CSA62_13430 [Planctomycetota bacterium]
MQQILDILMDNLFIVVLIVFGIIGNIGQSAATKKRKQRQAERRQAQRGQGAGAGQSTAAPLGGGSLGGKPKAAPTQPQAGTGEDELARRIRDLLEGGPTKSPSAQVQTPPKPSPAAVAPRRNERASEEGALAEDFHVAFDSEKTEAQLAEEKRIRQGGRPRPKVAKQAPSFESSIGSEFLDYTGLDRGLVEDPFAAGSFGTASSEAIDLAAEQARRSDGAGLPSGVRPKTAFAMMFALGPCRAVRAWEDEEGRY